MLENTKSRKRTILKISIAVISTLTVVLLVLIGIAVLSPDQEDPGAPALSPETSAAASEDPNDIVIFGSYPQTEVTDGKTVAALNALPCTWLSYGYYTGTGEFADGKMTASDYMQYCDVNYGGQKYRGVVFSQYRPTYTGYSSSADNSFQDENGYATDTVYWFRYEPLHWRVLDPDTGLMLCETIIDSQPYNSFVVESDSEYWNDAAMTVYAYDYEKSTVRQWLIADFWNTAFTPEEQSRTRVTEQDNSAQTKTPLAQYDIASTNDKIFLLSYDDAVNTAYGFSDDPREETGRLAKGTDYAKCQGLYTQAPGESSHWRLRSPGHNTPGVCFVSDTGVAGSSWDVNETTIGIRPAIMLDLNATE